MWSLYLNMAYRKNMFLEAIENKDIKIKEFLTKLKLLPNYNESNDVDKSNQQIRKEANQNNKGVFECCDIEISYFFQEDSWHRLFMQSLLVILVTSRWLITKPSLVISERNIVLIIAIATFSDTLDLSSYLNLQIVYQNNYCLYSTLLIISLSLLKFVFVNTEYGIISSNLSDFDLPKNNFSTNDEIDTIYHNNLNDYKFPVSSHGPRRFSKSDISFNPNLFRSYLIRNRRTECCRKYFYRFFCCCLQQSEPLIIFSIIGLLIHDGSYLTLRVFILYKLGFEQTANISPSLYFFTIKNIFLILSQVYKVYRLSNEKKEAKLLNKFKSFVSQCQFIDDVSRRVPNNPMTHTNTYLAAAAAGGQIPLINLHHLNQYQQNLIASNPYRFAQVYSESGTQNNPIINRSMSSLGSTNTALFHNFNKPNNSACKSSTLPHTGIGNYKNRETNAFNNNFLISSSYHNFVPTAIDRLSKESAIKAQSYQRSQCDLMNEFALNPNHFQTPIKQVPCRMSKNLYSMSFANPSKTSLRSGINDSAIRNSLDRNRNEKFKRFT